MDGLSRPNVTSITCASGSDIYVPGDTVHIDVTYSRDVSVVGSPQLFLNTNSDSGNFATYIGQTDSKTLRFSYNVTEGDFSHALDLSDNHAVRFTFRDAWKGTPYESKLRDSIYAAVSEPYDKKHANRLESNAVIPFKPGKLH